MIAIIITIIKEMVIAMTTIIEIIKDDHDNGEDIMRVIMIIEMMMITMTLMMVMM